MGYDVPMEAIGKFNMGGGVYSDSIFLLKNGWKIKFWSGTYQAVITGTLLGEPSEQRTVPPDSGNVEVVFQVSSQATVIPEEAEWTQTEKNGILSDVNAIQTKTENLPIDPSSEATIQTVKANITKHDIEIKGEPTQNHSWNAHEASLIKIKEAIDKIELVETKTPKSIAQHLESKS